MHISPFLHPTNMISLTISSLARVPKKPVYNLLAPANLNLFDGFHPKIAHPNSASPSRSKLPIQVRGAKWLEKSRVTPKWNQGLKPLPFNWQKKPKNRFPWCHFDWSKPLTGRNEPKVPPLEPHSSAPAGAQRNSAPGGAVRKKNK